MDKKKPCHTMIVNVLQFILERRMCGEYTKDNGNKTIHSA